MTHVFGRAPAAPPTPSEFMAYLRNNGWVAPSMNAKWALFERGHAGGSIVLDVPLLAQAPDYGAQAAELLGNLELIEGRDVLAIARDVRAVAKDVVRLALRGPGLIHGGLQVERAGRVYERARELALAAACAALEPRSVFAKRKPDTAMDYLREAAFGPTESSAAGLGARSST